jgi:IMP dehydrogenase
MSSSVINPPGQDSNLDEENQNQKFSAELFSMGEGNNSAFCCSVLPSEPAEQGAHPHARRLPIWYNTKESHFQGATLMHDRIAYQGITFDDVLLEPAYSDIVPRDVDIRTQLTRNISLNLPIVSSPMDSVTESELAIALAQEGGIGIIHKNMTIERQTREVDKVKRSENGIITDPVTLPPDETVRTARRVMEQHNISGVPITVNGHLKGILTRRDLRFLTDHDQRLAEVMTKDNLVTAPEHTTLEAAERILTENKVEKLLLVDETYRLKGLITIKDIDKLTNFPQACKDKRGRLRVGAAIGVFEYERAESLMQAGVDVLVVDSAHGHSANVLETVSELKRRFDIDIIAGNVATAEGARALAEAGADAIKVGLGPGSICTSRVISGVGVPQITAIYQASQGLADSAVPLIADGGIRYSGDISKALAAGAHCVMLGSLLAGLAESPGQTIIYRGRSFKTYRGMGSIGAMVAGSSDRYQQGNGLASSKLVPEGVEGRVPYKGPLGPFVYQLIGGLRAGMGYCGCRNIEDLRTRSRFILVSGASVQESHPHDIVITQEAPNYSSAEYAGTDGG